MRGAMSFLAGMGTGYIKAKDKEYDRARQDKLDKQQDELHTFKVDEFKRLNDDRAALQTTTAPATAREMEGPQTESVIAATPAGQEPAPLGYIAGNGTSARGFAEKGLADAEATAQNKPEARRTRMADLAMQGNAFASTALRDNVQTEAAMGQLKEQTELQGHREFARNVVGSFQKGWGGFTQFATDKFDDGNTYTATEDGKGGAVIVSTGKDGKEVGRQAFASPEEAITFSVGRADPMKWVDYKTNAANKKADQGNKDREFILSERKTEIAEKQAALAEKKMDFMIYGAAARARAGAGGGGGGSGGASGGIPGVALKDRRDYLSDFESGLEDPKTAIDAAGAAAIQQRNQSKLVQADAIFSTNAALGTVLTAPQAYAAMELAKDPKNTRKVMDNNTGTTYEVVMVNGAQVIVGTATPKEKARAQEPEKPPERVPPKRPANTASTLDSLRSTVMRDKSIAGVQPVDVSKLKPTAAPFGVKRW